MGYVWLHLFERFYLPLAEDANVKSHPVSECMPSKASDNPGCFLPRISATLETSMYWSMIMSMLFNLPAFSQVEWPGRQCLLIWLGHYPRGLCLRFRQWGCQPLHVDIEGDYLVTLQEVYPHHSSSPCMYRRVTQPKSWWCISVHYATASIHP